MTAMLTPPGEIAGYPKLEIRYPTNPDQIAALLPPGLEPTGDSTVSINIYCVPVHNEPEYGVSTKIPARFNGIDGQYCLGIGIDQEAAIFISQETNGQPKFPCDITYYRLVNNVTARCVHQGRTFLEYTGSVTNSEPVDEQPYETNEWWTKYSRAVGGTEGRFDFPPHVVRVRMVTSTVYREDLDGTLVLHDSDWDPYQQLLTPHGPATAALVTSRPTERSITTAGPLDADAFWPFADTIGGSRWPGNRGGPRASDGRH